VCLLDKLVPNLSSIISFPWCLPPIACRWETTRTEWARIRVIAPALSCFHGPCTIWATTFFGVVARDHLVLGTSTTFLHHIIIFILHHSSSFHHLIFFLSLILSPSLTAPLAPRHFNCFPAWVATPLIHPFFSDKKPSLISSCSWPLDASNLFFLFCLLLLFPAGCEANSIIVGLM